MKRKVQILVVLLAAFTQVANAQWTQIGTKIDGEANGDQFGRSISISGDGLTIAIGGHANDGVGSNAGHVRVLKNVAGAWVQQGADIDGVAANDYFGGAVSLSNDGLTVAVAAFGSNNFSGDTKVYQWNNGAWVQLGNALTETKGTSVSLSNDGLTVALGSRNTHSEKVYKYVTGAWVQQGAGIDDDVNGDNSGESVSLSGDGLTIAIGSPESDGNGTHSGLVRVLKNIAGTWTQVGSNLYGEAAGDEFGSSVSLTDDGTTLAVGAMLNGGNGVNSGHVRVYKNVSGTWTQQGTDIDGEAAGDRSGRSVSLSDDGLLLAIGATGNFGAMAGGSPEGHARVYRFISGSWVQLGNDFDGVAQGDAFGWSVSLSGDGLTFAVSAMTTGINKGSVNVYQHPVLINLVSSITVQGAAGATTIAAPGGTLQMEATVLPANAIDVTYTWSVVDQLGSATIDANGLLTATSDGDVKVIATANDASGISGEVIITISGQVNSINNYSAAKRVSIYPNPANSLVHIQTESKIENIKVLSLHGEVLIDKVNTDNTVDVSDLVMGVYILEVQMDNVTASKRLIKE